MITSPLAKGRGLKSKQIRELQSVARRLQQRPGPGRATTETPSGTFVTPTKRPTSRGGGAPALVQVEGYWA